MGFTIEETPRFKKEFSKLPKEIKRRINKQLKKVTEAPYSLGKPLGYRWFRELKIGGYRAYYFVYEEILLISVVALSSKKDQQEVIDEIKSDSSLSSRFAREEEERYIYTNRLLSYMDEEVKRLQKEKERLMKEVAKELAEFDRVRTHKKK